MTDRVARLRWFFRTEEELLPYAAAGKGTIVKVEIVKRPECEYGRGPFFHVSDFEAKIIGPPSLLTAFTAGGIVGDEIRKIDLACPLDYTFPFDRYADWYDVSQIYNDIDCGIYYVLLVRTWQCLIALCVSD